MRFLSYASKVFLFFFVLSVFQSMPAFALGPGTDALPGGPLGGNNSNVPGLPGGLGNNNGSVTPSGNGSVTPPSSNTAINFANPLQYDTVEGVLGSVLGTIQAIIVVLSLVFIVIGAVLYITSAGNDKRMETAKSAITASMIGLALGLAAPSFLKEIGMVLGWGEVDGSAVGGARTLSEIAMSVLQFLLSVVGVLAIIMMVVGGIIYLTSAGDDSRIETGKKIVLYSVIGIAVALASLVIVTQIATFFV
ncbi:MAG: hypothetical protein ACSLEX_03360 [Minisyncoccota bacterium]